MMAANGCDQSVSLLFEYSDPNIINVFILNYSILISQKVAG
jgi:hypothetical protein